MKSIHDFALYRYFYPTLIKSRLGIKGEEYFIDNFK